MVFKYPMQNDRVARLLIARITGLAVQSLTVSRGETAVRRTPDAPAHDLPLTLLRMDFAARVRTADGSERQVPIETQKASAPTVTERFRRYLGQQIGSRDNILTHPSGPAAGRSAAPTAAPLRGTAGSARRRRARTRTTTGAHAPDPRP